FDEEVDLQFIQLKGKEEINFSVDSIYFPKSETGYAELEVQLSSSRPTTHVLPVSLYEKEGKLIAKSSAGFDQDTLATTQFSIPEMENLEAYIQIEDKSLRFDNTAFFNIQNQE